MLQTRHAGPRSYHTSILSIDSLHTGMNADDGLMSQKRKIWVIRPITFNSHYQFREFRRRDKAVLDMATSFSSSRRWKGQSYQWSPPIGLSVLILFNLPMSLNSLMGSITERRTRMAPEQHRQRQTNLDYTRVCYLVSLKHIHVGGHLYIKEGSTAVQTRVNENTTFY